jgi:hypothetical protein
MPKIAVMRCASCTISSCASAKARVSHTCYVYATYTCYVHVLRTRATYASASACPSRGCACPSNHYACLCDILWLPLRFTLAAFEIYSGWPEMRVAGVAARCKTACRVIQAPLREGVLGLAGKINTP